MKFIYTLLFLFSFAITNVFAQRIPPNKPVIVKATSTECNVCGLRAWDDFKDVIDKYETEAVIMAVHPLEISELFTNTSKEFMENMPVFFGTPSLYVNEESHFDNWFTGIRDFIAPFQERRVLAHPDIRYTIIDHQLKVEVNTQFLLKTNRPHYLSVYVLEDHVVEYQNSRGPDELHSKVLRTHLGDNTFGTLFSETDIVENQQFTNNFSLNLNANWAVENIEIVAIIWERRGETYHIVNSNKSATPTFATGINILEKANVSLSVQPTILSNTTSVKVDVPTAQSNLNITVTNTLGQRVKVLFSGDLPQGVTTFDINRNELGAKGLYFLVVEKAGSRLVEKMLVD